MSVRNATILIVLFLLGAIVFAWWIMGGSGVEFAVIGLAIAVFSASLGNILAMFGKQKQAPTPPGEATSTRFPSKK
ncbi:MAG: hypothetical protein ACKVZJ_08485 [Phycisphaerales bacterium]